MGRKKSPKIVAPPKQLESLIKSYALRRLQGPPSTPRKAVKRRRTKQ
jgi:hypothetical protein